MMLNAVLCVWNEEDVIESTVRHAFAQGCSKVLLIDNGSTDATVKKATRAGATHVTTFLTEYFDVQKKTAHLNAAVKYFNEIFPEERIWWMYLDADEFPNIDRDIRIIDLLKGMDSSVRGLHGHMLDHIPTHPPYMVAPYHPADFMPLCHKTTAEKILLLRYDKGKAHLFSACGAHTLDTCGETIPVAKNILNIHHFPMRNPAYTLNRLKKLVTKNSDGLSRVDRHDYMAKLASGDSSRQSQYRDRYESMQTTYGNNRHAALKARDIPQYCYRNITRWYAGYEEKKMAHVKEHDKNMAYGIHHYFLQEYDAALCKFSDALRTCHDDDEKTLLTSKIADCLSCREQQTAASAAADVPLEPDIQHYFGHFDVNWDTE